jgi:high-affinity iron transporter
LWMQTNTQGYGMVLAGMAVAAVALVIAAWLILRYSVRIPLRQFFAVSGVFMFILALTLAGKGVAALQEAGKLPVSPISFPRIEILGIYPSVQGLILQGAMVLLGVILLWGGNMRRATVVKPIAAAARRITGGH